MSAVTTPEKVHGVGASVERTISNSFVNVDGAVSVPPTEQEKRNQIVDDEERQQQQVDDSSDATAVDDDHQPVSAAPDGGLQAWLVVLGAWCASFCSYGWINSVGIFQQYYAQGPLKDYSDTQISWIPGLQIFFMSFMGPAIGVLFDRYGPERLLIVGSFLHVFGLMMASISTKYYQFLLSQGVCSAIGVAAVFLSAIACVSGWFDRRRGLAFGLLATGSSLGGVVLPIMVTRLIDGVSYGWAMRTGAFLIGALLVVTICTVRRRTSIPAKTSFTAAQMRAPFSELPFMLILGGLFLIPFGLYTPINYLPTAAAAGGMSQELAQYLVAVYNGASLVGRLSSGILADRFGRFNAFIASCYIAGALVLAMWIPGTENAVTIAFAALFGLFSGAYIALLVALIAQVSPIREIGYRNGIACLAQSVGGLLATPIAGAILARPGGLVGIKVYAGVFLLAGTTSVLLARLVLTKFKLKVAL
ncbi:Major facilitator superfamily domain, general substrate transporter [Cordyceps fumosorosea ARSEF 2679]|uniref:Major facilitator superfamily domain, general substrate transporter n=1 Tax=Cordyceps fumosorosea (strain ARSEF 2679) TaxID=1081104 RepID=A0A168CAN8_CORFA|nr:Major facilitator superfamily domain, general substrate transporter [Cordyceps fumosorosea ARSEF 2679]OAA71158.1 Major facilitator superfamily domain, general substrate transporter [Cordyceps fumosorosea ARSEF 2679]